MLNIFTSTFFFNRPVDNQSTSNDLLKPVMIAGLVNMHNDRSIANLDVDPDPLEASNLSPHCICLYAKSSP